MIKVEIDNKPYDIPSGWDELNLSNFMRLYPILDKNFDSDIDKSCNIISCIIGIDNDELFNIPLSDLYSLIDIMSWINVLPSKVVDFIMIDDVKYVPVNLSNITTGEFISLEVINKQGVEQNLHLMTSILIRPVVDNKIEKLKDMIDIQNRADLFKEKLMVGDLWPIISSFFNGAATSSLTNMQDYSNHQEVLQKRLKILNS
jgi:hypothetical protein